MLHRCGDFQRLHYSTNVKSSPLFRSYLGAAILVSGLLAVSALFGEKGLIVGIITLVAIVLANPSRRYRKGLDADNK